MQDLFPLLDPFRVVFGIHAGALDLLITTESIINSYKKPFSPTKCLMKCNIAKTLGKANDTFLNVKQFLALCSIEDTLKS